jgi:hypothetical protein
VQSQSEGPVACMGVNKWGCLADHAQELQQARKLPLAPEETVVRGMCSSSLVGPHPSRTLHHLSHHPYPPDHCFPCATALQICLPPALMSAASQRRAPLLSCYRTPAVRWEALQQPSVFAGLTLRTRLLTDCVEEYASEPSRRRHFSIAAAPTRTSYSSFAAEW